MSRTRIKFCGITRVADCLAAAQLGADAIGMVLHADSSRKIPLELAKQIVDVLPPFVTPVGLFVDAPADLIRRITDELHIRHVQLHGHETPEILNQLKDRTIIKAVRVIRSSLSEELKPWIGAENLKAILLETGGTKHAGGSGVENDWQAIREAQQAGLFKDLPPIIAAGGLRPDNVAEVVRTIHPWAVDVSSGIESSRGVKSVEKMTAFFEAVRGF